MEITARLLKSRHVCRDQIKLFKEIFPEGAEPTLENCAKALAGGLKIQWAADYLLGPKGLKAYRDFMTGPSKVCNETVEAAVKVHDQICLEAEERLLESMAPAEKAYLEASVESLAKAFQIEED